MTTFTPVPTANREWGFWGTSIHNGYDPELTWDAASRFLAEHFGLTAEQARDVLDNRFGRHLADDLSFIQGGPTTAEAIISHLANRIGEQGWRKSFEATIRAETGKTYPRKKPVGRDELFTQIARRHLNIETLATRNSDSLDFHDVAVWSIQAALEAAFEAGKSAARPAKPNYENSKHQILIELLTSDTGATLQQMADATGWRKHSVSCAISAVFKNRRKLNITCTRESGKENVYRIITPKEGA